MALSAVIAVCEKCPALAAAGDEIALTRLMDEHADKTGHRLWAVSRVTHSQEAS